MGKRRVTLIVYSISAAKVFFVYLPLTSIVGMYLLLATFPFLMYSFSVSASPVSAFTSTFRAHLDKNMRVQNIKLNRSSLVTPPGHVMGVASRQGRTGGITSLDPIAISLSRS